MNPTIDLIKRHRSVRKYTPDPVPKEHVRLAVEAGQAASTSSAVQAYAVISVTDPDTRNALVTLTGGQQKVADCGAFLVICGDTRRHLLAARHNSTEHIESLESFLLAVIDASLLAQNMALAFESLDYAICYIGGIRNSLPEVDRLLDLPHAVYPLFGMCVGVPDESPLRRPRLPTSAVLVDDRYPDDPTMLALIQQHDDEYRQYTSARDGSQRTWSGSVARLFADARRPDIAAYYRSKGAVLA